MTAEVIKEFLVGLGFKVDEGGINRFTASLKKATLAAGAIAGAVTAAAGAVTAFVKGVATEFDAVSDLAIRVNGTAHEIMRLGYVAGLTDSSVEAVARSMDRLNRVAGEAFMGTGEGVKVFERLGIDLRDANGRLKNTSILMTEVANASKGLERGEQAAIFRKLGIDQTLVGTLTGDVSALNDEFDALYKSVDLDANKAAQASSDFMDSVGRLDFVFDTLKKAVAMRVLPQIKDGIDNTRETLVRNLPMIKQAVTPLITGLLRVAEALAVITGRVIEFGATVVKWFIKINKETDGWAGYLLAAVAAWKVLNLAFLASPLGILLALGAALILLLDDYQTWKEGGESLFDWSALVVPLEALIAIGKLFGRVIMTTIRGVMSVFRAFGALLRGDFSGAWLHLKEAGQAVKDQVENLKNIFKQLGRIVIWLAGLVGIDLVAVWDKVTGAVERAVERIRAAVARIKEFGAGIVGMLERWGSLIGGIGSPEVTLTAGQHNQFGRGVQITQQTNITVDGAANPAETGRRVQNAQGRVNNDLGAHMGRYLAGSAR